MAIRNSFSDASLPLFDSDEASVGTIQISADKKSANPPSYLRDHRKRLRDRFLSGGAGALPDYEVLELVLFRAIPRQDVKPLAHALIARFGSFNGVLSANAHQLKGVPGVGEAVICELKIIEAAAHRLARSRVVKRPVVSSWDALMEYCHTTMAHRDIEQFRVFFLDTKNTLLSDEEQARGTVNHVPVYPREIVKRALELNATALILVHNHPSGDPTPSEADLMMTRKVQQAAEALEIMVHDHVIIGKSCQLSFRAKGYL